MRFSRGFMGVIPMLALAAGCTNNAPAPAAETKPAIAAAPAPTQSPVERGKYLTLVGGCNDCHTPKKMTAMGPVPDTSLLLSGHPAAMPLFAVNRKEMEGKGLAVTNDMTAWVGPWGVSYSANLTPDSTGIGTWNKAQFIRAIREGKWKGLEDSRQLLPPMPWQELGAMSNEELSAIFAYLKSIKPVHNVVPEPMPPISQHH